MILSHERSPSVERHANSVVAVCSGSWMGWSGRGGGSGSMGWPGRGGRARGRGGRAGRRAARGRGRRGRGHGRARGRARARRRGRGCRRGVARLSGRLLVVASVAQVVTLLRPFIRAGRRGRVPYEEVPLAGEDDDVVAPVAVDVAD